MAELSYPASAEAPQIVMSLPLLIFVGLDDLMDPAVAAVAYAAAVAAFVPVFASPHDY